MAILNGIAQVIGWFVMVAVVAGLGVWMALWIWVGLFWHPKAGIEEQKDCT